MSLSVVLNIIMGYEMQNKNYNFLTGILVSLFLLLLGCHTQEITEIKPVLINGKPRFIIGNYHNPNNIAELKTYAQNGFNLVRCNPQLKDLDTVKKAGLYAWLNTGNLVDFSKEPAKRKKALLELINRVKDHPALAIWEVPDEILWNLGYPVLDRMFYGQNASEAQQDSIINVLSRAIPETARGLALGCDFLRQQDPAHPVWMNHAPRNTPSQLKLFSDVADIAGCDIYPHKEGLTGHSDIIDNSLSAVGGYTDIMQNSAPTIS